MDWRDTARGPPGSGRRSPAPSKGAHLAVAQTPAHLLIRRPELGGAHLLAITSIRSELGHSRDTTWPGQGIALWWHCLSWKKVASVV